MTFEQIKSLVQYGDYVVLSRMLEIRTDAAKMRFLRGDKQAARAMKKIVLSREKLIADFLKRKKRPPIEEDALDNTPETESWLIGEAD
jgi:hypothetical protein